jgi:thioredoxin reductase
LEAYENAVNKQPSAPVPLDTFVEYGKWFRHQLGSDLDPRTVVRVSREKEGFKLLLGDGNELFCRSVVVAAGIGPFLKKPEVFRDISSEHVLHC